MATCFGLGEEIKRGLLYFFKTCFFTLVDMSIIASITYIIVEYYF